MNCRKFHLKNFGCQMNKLDSGLLAAALADRGLEQTENASDADVVIINTCSVRQHAEDRVLSHLGHLKHLKKSRPGLLIAVIGCMAQRLGKNLLDHDTVDIVAGPAQLPEVPDLIQNAFDTGNPQFAVTENIRTPDAPRRQQHIDRFEFDFDSDKNHIKSQAFIRVMRGCNNFCSYCIVPYVRGPEISRPPKIIIEQARRLAEAGIKQITLLGQNVNAYRFLENGKTWTLADLLETISQIEGVRWLRFITSHPGKFDESILNTMAALPSLCPYLHIPAQSGSDKILAAMNRGYSAGQYIELIEKARTTVPDVAIAGDFIVGFPGESDRDFADTLELVKKVRYKNCFVFKYSPRPDTAAWQLAPDNIPPEVKQQRNMQLLELINEIAEEDNRHFVGKTLEVLVEGPSKKSHLNAAENEQLPQLIGRTNNDYIVVFNGPLSLTGRFARITITKSSALTLHASVS